MLVLKFFGGLGKGRSGIWGIKLQIVVFSYGVITTFLEVDCF